jgi:hypothetical protein
MTLSLPLMLTTGEVVPLSSFLTTDKLLLVFLRHLA